MIRGSDSTIARSSMRPPMVAGPMLRNLRFLSALSYDGCAHAIPRGSSDRNRVRMFMAHVNISKLNSARIGPTAYCGFNIGALRVELLGRPDLGDGHSRWAMGFGCTLPQSAFGAGRFERPTPCAQGGFRPLSEMPYFQHVLFQRDAGSLLKAVELY